jgi:hypothetical protein
MLGKFGLVGVAEPPTSATGWFGHPHTNRRRVAETNPKANGGGRSYKGLGGGFSHPHFTIWGRPSQATPDQPWEWLNHPLYFFQKVFLKKKCFYLL